GERNMLDYLLELRPRDLTCPILMGCGDRFGRNPLEHLDYGAVPGAHEDGYALGHEFLSSQPLMMLTHQTLEVCLPSRPRPVGGDDDTAHGKALPPRHPIAPRPPTANGQRKSPHLCGPQSFCSRPGAYSSRYTFSRRSCISCASRLSVAIGRASSRAIPMGSPVSSQ